MEGDFRVGDWLVQPDRDVIESSDQSIQGERRLKFCQISCICRSSDALATPLYIFKSESYTRKSPPEAKRVSCSRLLNMSG